MKSNSALKNVIVKLTPEANRDLSNLSRDLGWSSSRVIRGALRLLAESRRGNVTPRAKGLRKFEPKVPGPGPTAKQREKFGQ